MPQPKRQSNTRRDLVSSQILEKAAALFAERGFSSTSLQDVAQALQISRTALYHYIGGKDELLATLVRGISQETADGLEAIAADETLDPVAKLDAAIRGMATRIANNPARFRLLLMSEASLPKPLASEHHAARRRSLEQLASIVREGAEAGVLRPMDDHVAAFSVLGMCNWIAWWYRPDYKGGQDPEEIAADIATLGVASLRVPSERAAAGTSGVEHAMELLRQDLDYLQRVVQASDRAGRS